MVFPTGNVVVVQAVVAYTLCLRDSSMFQVWTLEHVLDVADGAGGGAWAGEVQERYLGRGAG